ncbi:MAG: arginine--tRNA ligase, partial [Coleofasciculaceae cyanobacterium SM2_1_6]|nr:arginine--tRNA ligase [Coleofasciculaceae cyanobacterium SM2_1_6]
MSSALLLLKQKLQASLPLTLGAEISLPEPLLVPASNPKFGDYQSNLPLALAKTLGKPPRIVAEEIVKNLDLADICEVSIAGAGFINFTLKPNYLEQELQKIYEVNERSRSGEDRLGIAVVQKPQKIVVDFSSPNIAKEMHVGHLRSTIIGDSIARILEFQGHEVLRLNHVGDWGTQFGMLIAYLQAAYPEALVTQDALDLGDLVAFYRQAKQRFDADPEFQEKSRQEVVKLQSGVEATRRAWQLLCQQSRREFQVIYDLLGVELIERGESFYNPFLGAVVEDLTQLGLLEEDGGAKCVFLEGFTNKSGDKLPLIIQKTDGGYNYATTDLAALRYRIKEDQAQKIIYVTDAGQANHFTQ